MLKDKELKKRKKEIEQLDAQWSKAQKDVARAKIAVSDAEADIFAREQAKNKQISDCKRNGEKFNYEAPMSSQADVNKMFTKIQKLSEQDRLSIMRKEVKLKKMMFSQLPADFVLFKQYNLSSSQMYKNLLDLHAVDPANQETVSKADIYVATDDLSVNPSLTASKTKKKTREAQVDTSETSLVEAEWPPHDEEFINRGHATLHLAVLVGRSVGPSVTFLNSERFLHYCSTIPDWIAVYPALFYMKE